MKNTIILLNCFLCFQTLYGQILVRNENWPNPNWTVTGNYTPQALLSNPTINSYFSYDTSLVTPSGFSTLLWLTSPFFNLQPAFDGNEKFLKLTFNIAYESYTNDVLYIQVWNQDTGNWFSFPEGSAPLAVVGNFKTCTFDPIYSSVTTYFDFSSLSSNQMQNFRYRFVIDGKSSEIAGVCLNAVKVNSLSCEAPNNLNLLEVLFDKATIIWNDNSSEIQFLDIQYGFDGFVLGTGFMLQTESISLTPFTIFGLSPNETYNVYVRKNCGGFDGDIYSEWIGPLSFTTKSLRIDEFKHEDVQFFPNPTQGGEIIVNASETINEIRLFNVNGQELLIKDNKNTNLKINLSSLEKGMYLMRVSTVKGTGVYKVIKN
jgi:hypothetical protein